MAKKFIALLLALGLLVTALALPASAADAAQAEPEKKAYVNPNGCKKGDTCKYSPVIILPGINQSKTTLYVDDEPTDLSGGIVFPDTENMKLAPVIFSLLASLFLQHDVGLTKSVYNLICGIFEPQRVDKNGEYVHDLRTEVIGRVSDMTESERHTTLNVYVPVQEVLEFAGEDHVFFFAFNLVGKVWDNVDQLDEYVDYVRALTGHDKVNFVNVSLGGTLFTGYIDKYGWDKLDQVINVVSAADGTDLLADLYARKPNRTDDFLYRNWFPAMFGTDLKIADGWNKTIGYAADLLIRIFPNKLFEGIISAAWEGILDTITLNCTQFWAMIPRDRYKELADMYLVGDEYAALRKEADRYHQAQLNLASNVKKAVADGVHINNIAGANLAFGEEEYTFFAAVDSAGKVNSDGIVGLHNASLGATGAAPGKTLPASYKPKKAGYMSPDGKVDCSTAVLPDNTWIFLDQHHEVGRNDAVLHLASELLRKPGMNIRTNPEKYPQFNYAMNTNQLRRWRLNEAYTLLEEGNLSAQAKTELKAAIKEGEAVRALTVGDAKRAEEATEALNALLREYGELAPVYEQTWIQKRLEELTAYLSQMALYYYGNNGYSEGGSLIRFWKIMLDK